MSLFFALLPIALIAAMFWFVGLFVKPYSDDEKMPTKHCGGFIG